MKSLILSVTAALALLACGASQRQDTIKAALVTTDASQAAYLAYDANRQAEIVAAATSLEQGRAALSKYRGDRSKVDAAFTVAYRAIAMAAMLSDDQSLISLQTAVADVVTIVTALTRSKP